MQGLFQDTSDEVDAITGLAMKKIVRHRHAPLLAVIDIPAGDWFTAFDRLRRIAEGLVGDRLSRDPIGRRRHRLAVGLRLDSHRIAGPGFGGGALDGVKRGHLGSANGGVIAHSD